ncbi:hypothetical protein GCM10022206_67700 [Streptomyces chiangmaiensis]
MTAVSVSAAAPVTSSLRTVTCLATDMRSPNFMNRDPGKAGGRREAAGTVAGQEWSKRNTGLTGHMSHSSST